MAAVQVAVKIAYLIVMVGNPVETTEVKVVMRIADGEIGFQGGLLGQCQPVVASERHDISSIKIDFVAKLPVDAGWSNPNPMDSCHAWVQSTDWKFTIIRSYFLNERLYRTRCNKAPRSV